MKIEFLNHWIGNSMKDGGIFPINFIEIYADIHPSCRYFEFTILNFGISITFKELSGVKAIWTEEK